MMMMMMMMMIFLFCYGPTQTNCSRNCQAPEWHAKKLAAGAAYLEEVVAGNHLAQAEADLPHCCQRLAALLAGPAAERRLYGVKRSDALPHRQPVLPAGQFGDEDEEAELRDPATTVEDVLRLLATQHGRCAHCLVRALLA